jgi:hypothetical protein
MKRLAMTFAALCLAVSVEAQETCAAAPTPTWTVQFFERWEDAVAKIVSNNAYRDSAALIPIRSATKNGYVVTYERWIEYTTDCPPQPIGVADENTEGWRRTVLDTPAMAESFITGLLKGTPVAISTLHVGYAAGNEEAAPVTTTRRRATNEVTFAPRGMVVVWYDPATTIP